MGKMCLDDTTNAASAKNMRNVNYVEMSQKPFNVCKFAKCLFFSGLSIFLKWSYKHQLNSLTLRKELICQYRVRGAAARRNEQPASLINWKILRHTNEFLRHTYMFFSSRFYISILMRNRTERNISKLGPCALQRPSPRDRPAREPHLSALGDRLDLHGDADFVRELLTSHDRIRTDLK